MKTRQHSDGSASGETALGFAVLGCLVACGVGVFKAMSMKSGFGVLLCLLPSVATFGMTLYIFFRRG